MQPKAEGSISVGLVLLLMLVAVLGAALALAIALAVEMSTAPFAEALAGVRADVLSIALCRLVGLALATGVGVILVFGSEVSFRDALEVRPVPAAVSILALTAGFALAFPLRELCSNLLGPLHPLLAVEVQAPIRSTRDAIAIPIALVAIPAIAEELFFRGLLFPGLAARHGVRVAMIVSALAGGLAQGVPGAIVSGTLAGLVLGTLRQRSGSVLPCIALRGALAAVPLCLPAQMVPIPGLNVADGHIPVVLTLGGALVALASLSVLGRMSDDEG